MIFLSPFSPLSGGSFSSNNDAIRIRYSGVVLLNKKVFDMGTTTDEGENRTPPRICFLPTLPVEAAESSGIEFPPDQRYYDASHLIVLGPLRT